MKINLNLLFRRNIILVLLSVFLILFSCNKEDYKLFEVKTLTVKMVGNDTVQVEGIVTHSGSTDIVCNGFCMSTDSVPLMDDNQILRNGTVGKFSANITDLEPGKVYYFRAFAANEITYVYGNIVRFQVAFPPSPVVPCTLENNKFIDNGSTLNVYGGISYINPTNGGVYKISIGFYNTYVKKYCFEFMQKPRNGIYTTSTRDSFTNNNKNVFGYMESEQFYYVNPGYKIYITTDSTSGKMSLSFCELYYQMFSYDLMVKGKATF